MCKDGLTMGLEGEINPKSEGSDGMGLSQMLGVSNETIFFPKIM